MRILVLLFSVLTLSFSSNLFADGSVDRASSITFQKLITSNNIPVDAKKTPLYSSTLPNGLIRDVFINNDGVALAKNEKLRFTVNRMSGVDALSFGTTQVSALIDNKDMTSPAVYRTTINFEDIQKEALHNGSSTALFVLAVSIHMQPFSDLTGPGQVNYRIERIDPAGRAQPVFNALYSRNFLAAQYLEPFSVMVH